MVFPRLHLQIRPVVGRLENVAVASGGKSICSVPLGNPGGILG
jgi:hypothetical protein